jgi:hypothetical protein
LLAGVPIDAAWPGRVEDVVLFVVTKLDCAIAAFRLLR